MVTDVQKAVKDWVDWGYPPIGAKGRYGGTVTILNNLPIGTKFYVENGHWEGTITEVGGGKFVSTGDGCGFSLQNGTHIAEITIE